MIKPFDKYTDNQSCMCGLIFSVKKIASLILTHIWLLMRFRQNFVSLQSILGGRYAMRLISPLGAPLEPLTGGFIDM